MNTQVSSENNGPMAFRLKKCVDPRVDTEDLNSIDNEYVGYVGAQNWNRYSIPATVYTQSELKFTNIQSPGPNVLWDKKWWIEYLIKVTISNIPGTLKSPKPFISEEPAIFFRPYPLHQTTNSIQVRINNRDIQSYPMENLNARMEYWPQDKLKLSCGCCPHRKYNGQTFADSYIRKGNAPYGDMNEFTDQDYPNSTLVDIVDISVTNPVVDSTSSFERNVPFKAYKLASSNAQTPAFDLKTSTSTVNTPEHVLLRYVLLKKYFAEWIVDPVNKYNGIVAIGNIKKAKDAFLATEKAKSIYDKDASTNDSKIPTDATNGITIVSEDIRWLDVDFLNGSDVKILITNKTIELDDSNSSAKVYWSGALCNSRGSYTLTARIREPVIAEPLDFTSSADFGRSMWNITSVELRYTFNNYLKNMIAIDEYKLMKNAEWYWAYEICKSLYEGKTQNSIINDDNINIEFVEAPRLIYNIATPFVPPNCPFICAHKQFQRYESHLDVKLNSENINRKDYINIHDAKKITAVSEAYPLQFHPNAIYLWVGERNTNRYSSPNRYFHVDSYAKICGVRITYGNTSNILAQFDDHELFQMSLRNGLQDRTFLDWNAIPKSITTDTEYGGYKDFYGYGGTAPYITQDVETESEKQTTNKGIVYKTVDATELVTYKRYAGIGSVIKLIPGIDVLTGDTTNPLVAGMHAYSATIKIEVDFIPLNINEAIDYSLYVMFEYDGVCTINANSCDLGMIAIDSWAQLKATPKARTIRETYAYGSGLGERALDLGRKIKALSNTFGIVKRIATGSGAINGLPGMAPKMSGGKFINPKDLNGGNFYTPY